MCAYAATFATKVKPAGRSVNRQQAPTDGKVVANAIIDADVETGESTGLATEAWSLEKLLAEASRMR